MSKLYALKGEQKEIVGVPEIISILPLGHVNSQKGDFDVDEESFQSMKAHMQKRGIDIVIDYEHQTLENVQAPAGGWIKDIYLQDGAIAAKVEWTPTARKYLENKEYRYLSPVILVRKTDGKATVLHSVALTNTPAIDGDVPNYKFGQIRPAGRRRNNGFKRISKNAWTSRRSNGRADISKNKGKCRRNGTA